MELTENELLRAAVHCLRSYQYGNASPELAKALADRIEAALAESEPGQEEPWLFAISEPSGAWHDGEQCVFGDRESAQDEVDLLNDDLEEGQPHFKVVPLYRALARQPQRRRVQNEARIPQRAV